MKNEKKTSAVSDNDYDIYSSVGSVELSAKLLRHAGPFFASDPMHILHVARIAARLPDCRVDPETMMLMSQMVADGKMDNLMPECIWDEISKGLMEQRPSRMLELLRESGALARIMPELDAIYGVPQPREYHPEGSVDAHLYLVLDYAAKYEFSLPVRFAALVHDLGKGVTPVDAWPSHHKHEYLGVRLSRHWRPASMC